MERRSISVPNGFPFQSMSVNPCMPLVLGYDGPRHVVEQVVPVGERGYMPSEALLDELDFMTVRGFTGWLRRDEAHSIGYFWLQGERTPAPNFQKIACWGRWCGVPERINDEWRLFDDVFLKEEMRVPAPTNDAEFRELVALFDRAALQVS